MNRIPVWKTIRYAYTFAFGEIGTIIGLIWIPMVAIGILQFLPFVLGIEQPAAGENPATAGMAALLSLIFLFVTLGLNAMIYVVVTRQALGLRQGAATFHFAFGRPEWQMVSAMLLCAVLLGAMAVAFSATVALFALFLRPEANALIATFVALYVLAGIGGLIYAAVRLGFLLWPVVVAEEKVDLGRGWALTAGNFWRAFAVILAVTAPVLVVNAISILMIGGPGLFASPPAGADFSAAMTERIAMLDSHMPALIGLGLILAPFSCGLMFGAAAGAYRALVPARGQQI